LHFLSYALKEKIKNCFKSFYRVFRG